MAESPKNEETMPHAVLPLTPDPDAAFRRFVANANAVSSHARTSYGAPAMPLDDDGHVFVEQRTLLADLVPLKPDERSGDAFDAIDPATFQKLSGELEIDTKEVRVEGASKGGSSNDDRTVVSPAPTMREEREAHEAEAQSVVPDVRAIEASAGDVLPREASEEGRIPARELEGKIADLTVLLRYGHAEEVNRRLGELRSVYPRDLLLLRRIAEFHIEAGSKKLACEALFELAAALFQKKNVVGMRAALEQILLLSPRNPRATRLIHLLDRR